jgi:hypothetical protein
VNAIRLVFAANVLVAGAVGLASLFGGASTLRTVWQASLDPASQPVRVVGAFWTAIAVLSVCGLLWPRPFAAVLLVQLVYKASWLAVIALPAILGSRTQQIPAGIATFFAAWVVVLPFVIPWRELFART